MKNNTSQKQSQFFDTYAKNVGILQLEALSWAENNLFDYLISFLKDTQKKRVLDLGCGTGRLSLKLAKKAKEVIGIDLSEKSIQVANKSAQKYKIRNFKGIKDDFKKGEYTDYFDYVVAVNLIHHLDDVDHILMNIKKSLKKSGSFIFLEFNPFNPLYIPFLFLIGQLKVHLTKAYFRSNIFTLRHLLRNNGFKNIKVYRFSLLPTSLYQYGNIIKKIDETLVRMPFVNNFSTYHLVVCSPA